MSVRMAITGTSRTSAAVHTRCKGRMIAKRRHARVVKKFGNYLRNRRLEHNLTLRDLGVLSRIPHCTIYQFENQIKNPKLDELIDLGAAFDESLIEFLNPLEL